MLRKAYHWALLVLPAGWVVGSAFSIWVVIEGLAAYYEVWFRAPGAAGPLFIARDAFAIGACAALGVYRVVGFHPLFNDEYRRWLSFTPWRRGLPLPVGPVHLAPQDGLVLALVLLAMHDAQLPRLAVPAAFLLAYLGALLLSFAFLGFWQASYALAFALGMVVWLRPLSPPGFGLLAALAVASQFVLSRTFDEFPWHGRQSLNAFYGMSKMRAQGNAALQSTGWPFDYLNPNQPIYGLRYREGILLSLLIGWWAFALASLIPNIRGDRTTFEFGLRLQLPLMIAAVRLGTYLSHCRSPISMLGRLLTLRWIIPGFDRVFAAPICVVLTVILAPGAISELSAAIGVALPMPYLVLTLALLETLNMGPTLRNWRLTGRCRIEPRAMNVGEFIKL